ncbi:glycoside hydrolase family 88 protein [Paenibacillus sp. LHD-38]|uniref:glycoside hydrolase family 88/105 protein n=1 Tax=Paenibacillus sp. LHD-38 TaxID=3072143 RepID=UPI0028100BE0|nr:glycoside hydrolase family 88 protein [Paenibacillus sp. LHD-38]MDQ8734767.1 glycoside hydrolase family 88 protein [Paenibacillus sp. LHD-38]
MPLLTYELVDRLKEQYMSGGKWFSVRWHYIEGCILKAYLDSYEQTGCKMEYDFVKGFIEQLFDSSGNIHEIRMNSYNIDQIRMAVILFPLFQREQEPKYKRVMDLLYQQLESYPRTNSGSFWHKENYPYQVWLDGLYMGQPFLVQYVKQFAEKKDYSDTIQQFQNVRQYIYNEQKRLYSHAYDESRHIFWCDKTTGQSPNVWGRAVGWFAMALVDVLELLEGEPADTGILKAYLKELIDDMLPYRHNEGMWYQVVDRADHPDNYLESSGTLMLAYAILKGARLGYVPEEYAVYGLQAFNGTIARYLREEAGEVLLGGICRSAGLGKKPETGEVRDGSLEYYIYSEEVVDNNGHGVAPLFMAYNEIKRRGL